MVWLNPLALVGLAAVAAPVLIHLLRRRQARRIVVPSVRFVPGLDQSSVRLRAPSDVLLLLVRMAVLASAAAALAHPLFLTRARIDSWAARTARVVVVDDSESVRGAIPESVIASETATADPVTTVRTPDLRAGLRQASAWLRDSPPARREIVVLSDFQRGALAHDDLAVVPEGIGLRLRSVATGADAAEAAAPGILTPEGMRDVRVRLDDEGTTTTYARGATAVEGLRILAPPGQAGVEALRRVVGAAGARAPSAAQPIVIRFPGAGNVPTPPREARDWTFGAAQRLLDTPDVAGLPFKVSTANGALVVDIDAQPHSLAAATVVKAALDARPDPRALDEREVVRLPDDTLAAWSREPGPPDVSAWRNSDESDARWLWAAALLLLGVETQLRRPNARAVPEVATRAA